MANGFLMAVEVVNLLVRSKPQEGAGAGAGAVGAWLGQGTGVGGFRWLLLFRCGLEMSHAAMAPAGDLWMGSLFGDVK